MAARISRGVVASLFVVCLALAGPNVALAAPKEAPKPKQPAKTEKPARLDLNKATEDQLKELPGIGEAYSKKIVAGRPYKSVKDLARLGIPAPTLEKITPLVTVGAAKKPPKKGLVWVNTDTKVYHKEGSPWYGNTKEGKWMTEAEAVKAGNKAAGE